MVELDTLEKCCALSGYRGFESLLFRQSSTRQTRAHSLNLTNPLQPTRAVGFVMSGYKQQDDARQYAEPAQYGYRPKAVSTNYGQNIA